MEHRLGPSIPGRRVNAVVPACRPPRLGCSKGYACSLSISQQLRRARLQFWLQKDRPMTRACRFWVHAANSVTQRRAAGLATRSRFPEGRSSA
jgi:hypothetical protein